MIRAWCAAYPIGRGAPAAWSPPPCATRVGLPYADGAEGVCNPIRLQMVLVRNTSIKYFENILTVMEGKDSGNDGTKFSFNDLQVAYMMELILALDSNGYRSRADLGHDLRCNDRTLHDRLVWLDRTGLIRLNSRTDAVNGCFPLTETGKGVATLIREFKKGVEDCIARQDEGKAETSEDGVL